MRKLKPNRILYRIILPFTLLFGITTILSWLCSAYFITRYLDRNLKNQMEQVADIISRSTYVLNPAVLRQLQKVINAEIILFDGRGRILNTSFVRLDKEASSSYITKFFIDQPSEKREVEIDGTRYRTIVYPVVLPEIGKAFLSLWMPIHEANRLKSKIIFGIGGIALIGVLAMGGIGYLIAKTIIAPVEDLARVTGEVSRGDLSRRAKADSRDEIGALAASFNRMIDQLQVYEKKLVESEKMAMAGRMAAGMAHEIRNPLTSIRMLGQVLEGRIKDQPESRQVIRSMIKEIDRLDRIIQEMLNRTRPGELECREGRINETVDEVIRLAGEGLLADGIRMEQDLSENLPQILFDPEKIKQVLWNLINNAREAMPKGGTLRVSTRKENDNLVEILIEDTGSGVSRDQTERLFQPFFTTKPEGVGLGLTMSRKIVEKHGGTLTLENRPGGGTLARVRLPIGKNV